MKKNQFIKVTDVEQNLFEKLSGQIDKVLLLYTNELKEGEEEYLEYYFTYSDATAENFGLETFYAKVKKTSKKNLTSNDLLSKAVSRLTEKMVKRNLDDDNVRDEAPVELSMTSSSLEEPIINNRNYGSSQKITSVEKTIIAAEDYSTKSQATYFFDCKGDGTTKGSFCCILQKGAEYFILTAGHNLQKGIVEKNYNIGRMKLVVEQDNYNILPIKQDSAILKITNFEECKDIISNRILFTSYNTPVKGGDCHIVGYDEEDIDTKNGNVDLHNSIYKTEQDGFAGMSGGPVFKDKKNLNGMYLGTEGVLKYDEILGIEAYKLYTL